MPAFFVATNPSYMTGTWTCGEGDQSKLIRFDPDGVFYQVMGPNDAIPVGHFWFSDGEFHVVSDRDEMNAEGVFEVTAVVDQGETYLTFKSCGGNSIHVDEIDWEAGMQMLLPPG